MGLLTATAGSRDTGVLDYLSMVNPMEQEMRRVNDISEREKATKAHKEFENMADYALQVTSHPTLLVRTTQLFPRSASPI